MADRAVQSGNAVVILDVRFTSVVLANDREMAISGLALMKDGSAGPMGKVKGKGNPVLAQASTAPRRPDDCS